MESLFGIRLDTFAAALAVLMAAAFGAIVVLALRNRIFFRLGIRNVTRRRGRSALIVAGLMSPGSHMDRVAHRPSQRLTQ